MGNILLDTFEGRVAAKPKEYITVSDLQQNPLWKNGIKAVKNLAIDRCENFMMDKATSAFSKYRKGIVDFTGKFGYTAGAFTGTLNSVASIKDETFTALNVMKDLTVSTVEMATAKMTNMAGEFVGKMTQLPISMTSYFAERTAYWTTYFIKEEYNAVKAAQELLLTYEDEQKLAEIELKKQRNKNILIKINNALEKANKQIVRFNDCLQNSVGFAVKYIQEGPDFIQNNIVENVNTYLGIVDNALKESYKDAEEGCRNVYNNGAKAIGKLAGKAAKALLKRKLNKINQKIENKRNKVVCNTVVKQIILESRMNLLYSSGV